MQSQPFIAVPEAFATTAIRRDGEAGRQWIGQLPTLIRSLCEQWKLVVDGPAMHGYLSLVVPVRRENEPCALKVGWPDQSTIDETAALAAWDGKGAVLLLETEPLLGAMLLERLDHRRSLEAVDIEEAVVIAGRLLRRLAIPAPASIRPLHRVAPELTHLMPERWERYGRPLPRPLLEQACALATQLGQAGDNLLVNYDLHYADVLAGRREPWLAVDPKVVAGDLEYGIAQLLWRRLEEMQAQAGLDHYFHLLVEAAALDHDLARAWTLVRSVDYWLWAVSAGLTEDPVRCERITSWLMQ